MRRFWSVLVSGQSEALSVHLFGQSQPRPHEFKRFGHCRGGTQHADIKRGTEVSGTSTGCRRHRRRMIEGCRKLKNEQLLGPALETYLQRQTLRGVWGHAVIM